MILDLDFAPFRNDTPVSFARWVQVDKSMEDESECSVIINTTRGMLNSKTGRLKPRFWWRTCWRPRPSQSEKSATSIRTIGHHTVRSPRIALYCSATPRSGLVYALHPGPQSLPLRPAIRLPFTTNDLKSCLPPLIQTALQPRPKSRSAISNPSSMRCTTKKTRSEVSRERSCG